MRIDIVEAADTDRAVVRRMAQLYQYDFTEFDDNDLAPDGHFDSLDTDRFFEQADRYVYIARAEGELAGFALVWRKPARVAGTGNVWYMSEFFVMRKYRRFGVGTKLATIVFDAHRGMWEVAQIRTNTPAQAFWRGLIGAYTAGEFTELDLDDEQWDGPMQVFDSSGDASGDSGTRTGASP